MTRALVLAAIVALASRAHADDSFEAHARGAEQVRALDGVVWALTATCDRGDDTERRQCRLVRDARAAELAGATLLVEADPGAFAAGTWNPQRKSVPFAVSGCIRCGGVEVDGKTWYIVASGKAPSVEGGKVSAEPLYANARPFADPAAAAAWTSTLGHARVELVVKLPAHPRWSAAGKDGIALDVLAYRVVAPCDGSVVVANPPSGPVAADPKQCGKPAAPTAATAPSASEPDELTPAMIQDAMKPVLTAAQTCYVMYGARGRATLDLTVSADGTIAAYAQHGDFAGTPTGACLDKAARAVHFPRTKAGPIQFRFPIPLP